MKHFSIFSIAALVTFPLALFVQESSQSASCNERVDQHAQKGGSWTKKLKERSKRGELSDRSLDVRGDRGKWSETPRLQHTPPLQQKPPKLALEDWADQLLKKKVTPTAKDDNWLLFRTKQLDDNDRVWVERIERKGNRFTVYANQAIWQGRYRKNFTYFKVLGVNLGKLQPGKYQARWIIQPMVFEKFEGPGRPRDNWPENERPDEKEPTELKVEFSVVAADS